jgi:hypothetical protein
MRALRFWLLLLVPVLIAAGVLSLTRGVAAKTGPRVELNAGQAGPRQVEESTGNAVVRDYAAAWQGLAQALDGNDPDLLGAVWVGFARDQVGRAIEQQKQSGIRTRYLDRGHKVEAVFYSVEGGAMQLQDTAQLEIQVVDGGAVVHSEQVTLHYLALMTPAADHWQVRLLQSVP